MKAAVLIPEKHSRLNSKKIIFRKAKTVHISRVLTSTLMDGLCKDHRPSNRFCEILCLIFLDGRFQIFMLPEKLAENFLLGLFKVIRGQEFKKGQIMANLILMVFTEISRQHKNRK